MSQSCCSLDAPKNETAHRLSGVSEDRGEHRSRSRSDSAVDGVWQEGGRENHGGISKGLMLRGAEGCAQPNEGIYVASCKSENPF